MLRAHCIFHCLISTTLVNCLLPRLTGVNKFIFCSVNYNSACSLFACLSFLFLSSFKSGICSAERGDGERVHDLRLHVVDELDGLRDGRGPRVDGPGGVARPLALLERGVGPDVRHLVQLSARGRRRGERACVGKVRVRCEQNDAPASNKSSYRTCVSYSRLRSG